MKKTKYYAPFIVPPKVPRPSCFHFSHLYSYCYQFQTVSPIRCMCQSALGSLQLFQATSFIHPIEPRGLFGLSSSTPLSSKSPTYFPHCISADQSWRKSSILLSRLEVASSRTLALLFQSGGFSQLSSVCRSKVHQLNR